MTGNFSHRLTASLIELILHTENVPRHRVLSAFVQQITHGFELTDAKDLEEKEGEIPFEVKEKIRGYGRLGSIERNFDKPESHYCVSLIDSRLDVLLARFRIDTLLD